ncbi:MAG: radical SAM protein [Deltaproteobacteria bacterium]|nr:MAG: radical SAM protein [Deltaproteobacteria bacterium]
MKKKRILPIFITHRGCPTRCIHCDQGVIEGVPPTLEDAFSSLRRLLRQWEGIPDEVAFYGGDFAGLDAETLEKVLSESTRLVREKFGVTLPIRVSASPLTLTESKIARLKKLGVSTVEVGVVSMDGEVLHRAGRRYSPKRVKEVLLGLREEGFKVGVQFVSGLPGDTIEKFNYSVKSVFALKPHFTRLYPLVVIKGTPLGDDFLAGRFIPPGPEFHILASALHSAWARRFRVSVARVGLHTPSNEGKVIARPGVKNIRQKGEGLFLHFLLSRLRDKFGSGATLKIPSSWRTIFREGEKALRYFPEGFPSVESDGVAFSDRGYEGVVLSLPEKGELLVDPGILAEEFSKEVTVWGAMV